MSVMLGVCLTAVLLLVPLALKPLSDEPPPRVVVVVLPSDWQTANGDTSQKPHYHARPIMIEALTVLTRTITALLLA